MPDTPPPSGTTPGTVLTVAGEAVVIACGQGCVAIAEGQAPGRKRLPIAEERWTAVSAAIQQVLKLA